MLSPRNVTLPPLHREVCGAAINTQPQPPGGFSACPVIIGVKNLISGNLSPERVKIIYINRRNGEMLPRCCAPGSCKEQECLQRGREGRDPAVSYLQRPRPRAVPSPELAPRVEGDTCAREFKPFMSNTHSRCTDRKRNWGAGGPGGGCSFRPAVFRSARSL